jgi:DNA repair exonuclease SbcCD nuclease subunit
MKIAIVTDVHIGKYQTHKRIFRKNTRYSKKLLRKFVARMNRRYKPDVVIQCGDLIEDIDQKHDQKNYAAGVGILSRLKNPVIHVIGNHDQRNLDETYLKRITGREHLYYFIDVHGIRLICLWTKQTFKTDNTLNPPYLDEEQLTWLKTAVDTELPIIIFSHASLFPYEATGNFWFARDVASTYIKNYQQFQAIIKDCKLVLAVNGHLHWNKIHHHDGVPYVTIQSLVENTSGKVKGSPANAYALVDVDDNKIDIDIKGWGGMRQTIYL